MLGPTPSLFVGDSALRLVAKREHRRRIWHRGALRNDRALMKKAIHGVPAIFERLARARDRVVLEQTVAPSWRALLYRDPHLLLLMGDISSDLKAEGLRLLPVEGAIVASSDPSRPQRIAVGERAKVGEWLIQVDAHSKPAPGSPHGPLMTAVRAELVAPDADLKAMFTADLRPSWTFEGW